MQTHLNNRLDVNQSTLTSVDNRISYPTDSTLSNRIATHLLAANEKAAWEAIEDAHLSGISARVLEEMVLEPALDQAAEMLVGIVKRQN